MNTQEFKRVRYQKSPLIEVIYQVRFPTILTINSEQPAAFQNEIRASFPFFEEQTEENNNLLFNPQMKVASFKKIGENKNYSFVSTNNQVKINLTPSFLSISTMAYSQWEDFKETINYIIPIFEKIYKPAFYTRIGLRYIDAITRSSLNLENKDWTELIQPHILGMVTKEYEKGIKSYVSETEYETAVENVLSKAHFEFVHINDQKELSLLIDCDYYQLDIIKLEERNNASEKLHLASSHFMQTAITEDLSKAMDPVEIKNE